MAIDVNVAYYCRNIYY